VSEASKSRVNFYNENQVEAIFPYLRRPPSILFLAGPGDGNEAQRFLQEFPKAGTFLFEPNEAMRVFQRQNGYKGLMSAAALSDKVGKAQFTLGDVPHCSSMLRDCPGTKTKVDTLTIDYVFEQWKWSDVELDVNKRDAVLWIDVEGAELLVLKGSEKTLTDGGFQLINMEVLADERPDDVIEIEKIMDRHGFELVHSWNWMGARHDRIYTRK